MKLKKYAILLVSSLIVTSFLAFPATADESADAPEYSNSVDWNKFRDQNVTINVYNWGEYISVDDGENLYDTNREFE